jgi:hypothetical protein
MPDTDPERFARNMRTKAAAEKMNATPAVSRTFELVEGGFSIFVIMNSKK